MVKNSPAIWKTRVWSLDWENLLEKWMDTHFSILAWRIPKDRGAWWTTVHRVAKSQTRLSDFRFSSVQLSAQSCPTLWNPLDCRMPGVPVHHQLPEFTQTHLHWVSDAIQLSHPLSTPSPAFKLSQYQGLFKWVSSSHQVAKVLEFQLRHQPFQWIFRDDFL